MNQINGINMNDITGVLSYSVNVNRMPAWAGDHSVAKIRQMAEKFVKATACVSGGGIAASILYQAVAYFKAQRNPGIDPQVWKMIQERGVDGESLLRDALFRGVDSATIRFLLEKGVGTSSLSGNYGRELISQAICDDRPELVEMLVAHGADVNAESEDACTPLIEAVRLGQKKVVETLLKNCGANASVCQEHYPIIEAVRAGDIEMVKVLMACGVKLSAIRQLRTPLSEAVLERDLQMVQFLLGTGEQLFLNIASCNPFAIAMRLGRYDIADLLFQHGANPNRTHPKTGNTPLLEAIDEDDVERVKRLLDRYHVDINAVTEKGVRPLDIAIYWKNMRLVQMFVDTYGADVHYLSPTGDSTLTLAVSRGGVAMVTLLVETYRVDVNGSQGSCVTPLAAALKMEDPAMVEELLRLKANPNIWAEDGDTPLTSAMQRNLPATVSQLIAAGADEIYAEEFFRQKFLANICEVRGLSEIVDRRGKQHSVDIEGITSAFAGQRLMEYFQTFSLKNPAEGDLVILQSLKTIHCVPPASGSASAVSSFSLQGIDPNEPLIIVGGSNGHAISMVLFGGELQVCNRGAGSHPDYSIEIFLVNRELEGSLLVKIYRTPELFHKMIAELEQNGVLEKIGTYPETKQTMGNCPWAQGTGALGILFRYLLGEAKGEERNQAFVKFCRDEELERYRSSPNPDPDLIKKAEQKTLV